jgi:hypothetical protein
MTPYALAKASDGRISMSTAYRLKESAGRLETYAAEMLEALADVFEVKSMDELLERDPAKPAAKGKRG